MKKDRSKTKQTDVLRKRAEERIPRPAESIGEMSTGEIQKLVHELQVHQIELEMQNEALRKSQMETAEERRKYTGLYDFAPVGYFTLDRKGRITEANVTGASLLGFEKRSLAGEPFHRFITPGHFSVFQSHLQMALEIHSKQTCKLKLVKRDGGSFDAQIDTVTVTDGEGKFDHYRSSVTDIIEITEAEAEMARLASFPMLNPNPIAEVDMAGQIHYINPAAERLFPDLRQCGPGHPWLKDWETLVRTFRENGLKEIAREVKVDGHWFHQTLHLVEETQRLRIYGMDITARKLSEGLNQSLDYINERIHSTLDIGEVMNSVISEAARAMGCETAAISLLNADRWIVSYIYGFPKEIIGKQLNDEEEPHAVLAIKTKKPVVITDAFSDERVNREHMKKWNVRSVMVFPLVTEDQAIGVLFFNYHTNICNFHKSHIEFAKKLASIVSLAIENAHLFEKVQTELINRTLAEAWLKESEERFRVAQELSLDAFTILDAVRDEQGAIVDFLWVYVNPEAGRILRHAREKLVGQRLLEVLPGNKENSDLFQRYVQVVETGEPHNYELRYQSEGIDGWFRNMTVKLGDGIAVYFSDITERKKKEEELKRLNRILIAISDSSKAMMRATNETEYLHEVCRIVVEDCGHAMVWIGYTEDDEGKTVRPAAYAGFEEGYVEKLNITWADTERGRGPTGTAIRTGKPSACRNILTDPLFRPWREEATMRGYASSIVFPLMIGGKAFGALNIYSREPDPFSADEVKLLAELAGDLAYGITMIRFRAVYEKAKEALRESEDRYRHIVEDSTEMIARGDINGTLTFVNEAWLRNIGRDKNAYIGHNIREFIPPNDREKIVPLISRFNPGKTSLEVENRMILPSGESRWYLWNIQAIYDRKGRLIEFQGLGRDITDRKRAEMTLKEQTAQLEAANKELESFSYSVSHDLRAPLRAIDGYARMILKKQGDKFDEDTLRKFNEIRSSAQMMGRLIDDLLAFSRLGRKHMSMAKIDMDDLVREVWKELQVINSDRKMTLTVHSIPPGYGDRTLIKQVYSNLLENAVKFTIHQSPALIEAGGYIDGNDKVYYVRDNGVGFDMAYNDKLFGVFQRLHSTDDFEGTGVGLATVLRIIHRHGGRVWAEGKVNEGATFYFTLPHMLSSACPEFR